jgi:tape measure domain-containing protein
MALDPVSLVFEIVGLENFLGGLGQANDALEKLVPQGDNIKRAFQNVGDAIGNFGDKIWDVVSTTLGVMLRDAIEGIISLLGDLISASFDAANELQAVSFRLQNFNLQIATDAGMEYTAAMQEAVKVTQEQMTWIMRLAAQSPFDATDIGFVFSMAEAFGYTSDQSKELTESTMNFVAAMGLSSVEQKRVIINLGQMAQRGKITTREMNDLARGSLLPLADVLDRVAQKMGVTTAELTKMIMAPGAGVDYKLFMDAFNEMIAEEVRFQDAAQRMAYLFKAAMENVYQTARDVIGYYILIPGIIGPIGERVASFMETLTSESNWDRLVASTTRVGETLGVITNKILDIFFPPGANQTIVDRILAGLESIADWLSANSQGIADFFTNAIGDIASFIQNVIMPAINTFVNGLTTIYNWAVENGPLISDFFSALGNIISTIFNNLVGGSMESAKGGLQGFLDILKQVMEWVVKNQEAIAALGTVLAMLAGAFIAANVVIGIIVSLLAELMFLLNPISLAIGLLSGLLQVGLVLAIGLAYEAIRGFQDVIQGLIDIVNDLINTVPNVETGFTNAFQGAYNSVTSIDWAGLGSSIVTWIIDGVGSMVGNVIETFMGIWGGITGSVPTGDFFNVGLNIIAAITDGVIAAALGLAQAVINAAVNALQAALDAVSGNAPAAPAPQAPRAPNAPANPANPAKPRKPAAMGTEFWAMKPTEFLAGEIGPEFVSVTPASKMAGASSPPFSSKNVTNDNFNLTIHTQAQKEPIIQDFALLQAMA